MSEENIVVDPYGGYGEGPTHGRFSIDLPTIQCEICGEIIDDENINLDTENFEGYSVNFTLSCPTCLAREKASAILKNVGIESFQAAANQQDW